MEQSRIDLTQAEWQVMECLWEQAPRTGREAAEYIGSEHTEVLIDRLEPVHYPDPFAAPGGQGRGEQPGGGKEKGILPGAAAGGRRFTGDGGLPHPGV